MNVRFSCTAALSRFSNEVLSSQLRTMMYVVAIFLQLFTTNLSYAQSQPDKINDGGQSPATDSSTVQPQPLEPGIIHIVPFGNKAPIKKEFAPPGAHLTYWGGPVISQIHVVAVFWGPNVNVAITGPNAIDQFFTDITKSRYYDLLTEYSTVGITGSGVPATSSNQSIQRGVFDGKFTINPVLCPTGGACALTDAQIQTELLRQLSISALPQPVLDAQGNTNTFYMIYFPAGVSINLGGVRSCVSGGFCAYHSNTTSRLIPYGVEPDFAPPSGCASGCGAGTLFDQVTTVTSHEMSEAVTDALAGTATTTAPPLAWFDPDPAANPLAEIGDICIGTQEAVNAGTNIYEVQQEFSNVQNDCVGAPPNFRFNAPAATAPAISINVPLSIQHSTGGFNLSGYTGTVHFSSSDPTAVLPADYTFTAGDAGTHTFPITFSTLGDQTISAVDTRSAGFNGTATVNVNVTPDLTISESHSGGFVLGQTGSYSITISNNGNGPTTAVVSVVDALPTGLSATSISGTGWTCTLANLTCTRADALARNASYPAITLNVNVAANAPSVVTNVATVSGGGETNTGNDSVSDPTPIASPDLTVSKSHTGVIFGDFFQGETGATYTISVFNNGTAPTSAPVTVVDTLPASGLTATGIAGTGWTCTLATLTCTRSDALAPFTAYPPITVTVDVSLTAPTNITNLATVAGGGETNTANDVAQDVTIVLPPPAPDLNVGFFNLNGFVQGQTGTFLITVANGGTKDSSGTVTVVDSLPAGLTATSISGTGWTCDLPTLTCTRADVLPFSSSYPQITLAVAIAANAPATVTNTVTVSGGGDTNPANNTASSAIPVATPFVDLSVFVISPGSLVAGQNNAGSLSITINNFGNTVSTGAATVAVTLPAALSAASISGTGWTCTLTNLTCTRSDTVSAGGVFPNITVGLNVASNATGSISGSVAVSGGGDSVAGNNSSTFFVFIDPAIALIPAFSNGTVTAGQRATFGFIADGQPVAGTLTFTCGNGLPTGASCSFSPASVSVFGTQVTLTVSTTSRTVAAAVPDSRMTGIPPGTWLVLCTSLLLLSLRRVQRFKPAIALAGLLVLAVFTGCGGGPGTPGPPPITQNPNGTPAGTYNITVNAAGANSTAASQTFQLTVR